MSVGVSVILFSLLQAHYTVTMVYSINLATLTHAQTQQVSINGNRWI